MNGPYADREFKFESDAQVDADPNSNVNRIIYTATPLSFGGYTAIHRRMTDTELKRLQREQGRSVTDQGLYVVDILPAMSAFSRTASLFL